MKLGPLYENHDLVFATGEGTPLYHRNLALRHSAPALERAKLQGFRLYDLRHSCATLLLSAGESPKVVSERPGHPSNVLTPDTYSHVPPGMRRAATDELGSILFKQTGTQ